MSAVFVFLFCLSLLWGGASWASAMRAAMNPLTTPTDAGSLHLALFPFLVLAWLAVGRYLGVL